MKTTFPGLTTTSVSIRLKHQIWYDPDADVWVGYCPALGTYSQGTTPDEAEQAIESAMQMRVQFLEERPSASQRHPWRWSRQRRGARRPGRPRSAGAA